MARVFVIAIGTFLSRVRYKKLLKFQSSSRFSTTLAEEIGHKTQGVFMKKILFAVAFLSVLTLTNIAAQSSSLTVTGFPGYAEKESTWQLFVSREDGAKNPQDLLSVARGFGDIGSDGTVKWSSPPFPSSDDFFMYIVKSDGSMMVTPTEVTIKNGGGTVAFALFTDVK